MKLIQQSAEIWKQGEGLEGVYKQVERAARLCYKSEDKIGEDSYQKFLAMLEKKNHLSPLEHGAVYLKYSWYSKGDYPCPFKNRYLSNPYSKVTCLGNDIYVTTNLRVIKEHHWEEDLKYLCKPTEHHDERISMYIITSRGISHELVRHRAFSFCQESQRYVNYSKDKFNNELTFIIPSHVNTHCPNKEQEGPSLVDVDWAASLKQAEFNYMKLLQEGWKPQQARDVLPNATKTELVMTGFKSDWEQFFKLRCSKAAHPEMQVLANNIKQLINKD